MQNDESFIVPRSSFSIGFLNIGLILRDSWRITWKTWPLWALALLMFVAFILAAMLSLTFSALASAISFNDPTLQAILKAIPGWEAALSQLRATSAVSWIGLGVAAWIGLVGVTAATLMLQAASMRGVVLAVEGGNVSLGEMLRLGRTRAINLIKLSVFFSLLTAAIGVLPSLALLLIGDKSPLGVSLVHLVQTLLTPVTLVLNLLVLLMIMSIALEDFSPRAAFGRAKNIFRSAWWAFLIVFILSAGAVVIAAVMLIAPSFAVAPVILINPEIGIYLTLSGFACGGLVAAFFFLFTVVFNQALYALVYREAARLTTAKN